MRSGVFLFLQASGFDLDLQQQLHEELQVPQTSCWQSWKACHNRRLATTKDLRVQRRSSIGNNVHSGETALKKGVDEAEKPAIMGGSLRRKLRSTRGRRWGHFPRSL